MGLIADVKKIVRSTMIALHGLRHAYQSDKSFRMEVNYGIPAYLLAGWFLWPLAPLELLFFVFSYILILSLELVNTAFETMLEKIHPERHELIGRTKDIASAAVFLAFVFAASVILVLCWSRIF